jgi:hypothetical protein
MVLKRTMTLRANSAAPRVAAAHCPSKRSMNLSHRSESALATFASTRVQIQTNSIEAYKPKPSPTATTSILAQVNSTLLHPRESICWPTS